MARTTSLPGVLEVIETGHVDDYTTPTLVFVHGACHAAWCWKSFQEWFAGRGYRSLALSLRGHGGSAGHERLQHYGVQDYVDDVERVVREKVGSGPFVLVGHSMGGGVVQGYLWRLLATVPAPAPVALVLLGAITPSITRKAALHIRFIRPYARPRGLWNVLIGHDLYDIFAHDRETVRTSFFWKGTEEAIVRNCHRNLGPESWRTVATMYMLKSPEKDARIRALGVPVCVLGADHDRLLPPEFIRAAARAYGGISEVFPNRGHDLMLDQGWEAVADWIRNWIEEQVRGEVLPGRG